MTIPPFIKKLLLISNVLFWVLHLTLLSLPFYRRMPEYGINEWFEFAYNCASLIIAFYATAYFTNQWLKRFSITDFMKLQPWKRFFYVVNQQFVKILLVTIAYIILSIVLDNVFFGRYDYSQIPFQLERRLSRINAYVIGGPFYAISLFLVKMLIKRVRALETENRNLYKSVFEIENLYRALKKETATN